MTFAGYFTVTAHTSSDPLPCIYIYICHNRLVQVLSFPLGYPAQYYPSSTPNFIPMSSPMPARAQTSAPEEQVDESPRAKRPRYFSYGEQDSDDEDSTNDPESYYGAASVELSQEVNDFMKATFKRCLPKQQRLHMAKEYPKPSGESVKVPKIDQEIRGALGGLSRDARECLLYPNIPEMCRYRHSANTAGSSNIMSQYPSWVPKYPSGIVLE